jgi:hypothetical protein
MNTALQERQQEQQQEQHSSSSSNSQLVLAGSFQLMCPDPWQQQLVHLLVQQPSEQELAKLLQLLPGMLLSELQQLGLQSPGSCSTAGQHQQQQQQQQHGGIEPSNSSGDALNSLELLFAEGAWPSAADWQQVERSSSSPNNKQQLRGAADTAVHDMLQVSVLHSAEAHASHTLLLRRSQGCRHWHNHARQASAGCHSCGALGSTGCLLTTWAWVKRCRQKRRHVQCMQLETC